MIRNRRARNTTSNKQPEVLPGCFLESWVIDYPLTEKPEGSLKMFHSQDPHYRVCMEQRYTVADQDLAISERPVIQTLRKGGGKRSPKKVFSVPLASVWSKNKGGGGAGSPRPLP